MKPMLSKLPPQLGEKEESPTEHAPKNAQPEPAMDSKRIGFAMSNLYIKWKKEDELGIPVVDEQHRTIVGTINSLFFLYTNWQRA